MSDPRSAVSVSTPGSRNPAQYQPATGAVRLRLGVKALLTTGTRALLVRERHGDGSPFWTLPGGGLRSEESAVEGLRRELAEELRCSVEVDEARGSFWYAHTSRPGTLTRYAVFASTLTSTVRANPDEGVYEHRWVPLTAPPKRTVPQVRHLLADE